MFIKSAVHLILKSRSVYKITSVPKYEFCFTDQLTCNKRYLSAASIYESISNSTVVSYFQDNIVQLHDATGMPWWGTIIVSTVLLRTIVTLPLTIYQNKVVARIENISLEMPSIIKELKIETSIAKNQFNLTEKHARILYNKSVSCLDYCLAKYFKII